MTKEIYIGNLPYETTEKEVRGLCAPYGEVHAVAMITERGNGRFRGFCFVEMEEKGARKAITALEGKEVGGREIRASAAKPRKQKQKGQGRRQGNDRSDDRPLHERTDRGNYVGRGSFPHSGGGWGPQREPAGGNSKFPHSGGRTRR